MTVMVHLMALLLGEKFLELRLNNYMVVYRYIHTNIQSQEIRKEDKEISRKLQIEALRRKSI